MKTPGIRITRYPYEEPYHLNLRIAGSNGRIDGDLEYYCNVSDLGVIGKKLAAFSGKRGEQVVYELGSEKPEDRFAFFLGLRVVPLDSVGHCAVIVRLSNHRTVSAKEVSEFAIKAEVADVNRLGHLFEEFSRLEHRVLDWRVQDGKLIKDGEAA
jgi:hypothetical protein